MWDLPGPGLEPVSPVSAGGFLTTAPPGKPTFLLYKYKMPILVELNLNNEFDKRMNLNSLTNNLPLFL